MTTAETADAIRRIHAIFQQWNDAPFEDPFRRPRWTRLFNWWIALILSGGFSATCWILLHIHIDSPLIAHMAIWLARPLAWILASYAAVSALVDLAFLGRQVWDLANPFSKSDTMDLGTTLDFERKLAAEDPGILELTASAMEVRSKQMEGVRLFLIGIATFAAAALGSISWPSSPLRGIIQQSMPDKWLAWIQFWLLCSTLGTVVTIGAGWQKSIACASRGLSLRRVIANRPSYMNMEDPTSIQIILPDGRTLDEVKRKA